ncbi:MAG: hypothetical protein ABJ370_07300 [Paracoccaceae bacterium]
MSKFHPLWPGQPSKEKVAEGQQALASIVALADVSALETAFLNAAAAFYSGDDTPYPDRINAWANAQRAAYEMAPENPDAIAFQALGLLATAPRGEATYQNNGDAGALLEAASEKIDRHPGVYHYLIHAYDNPALYETALPFAQDYGAMAPNVPHALHMPSHIFIRAGRWEDAIAWDTRSARAALDQPLGDVISSHYAHAMDYLIYAYLQLGEVEQAKSLLAEFEGRQNQQSNFGSAYALAASPMRVAAETGQWEELANLSPEMHKAIAWEKFPQAVAMRWFAIGLGAARTDRIERADNALSELHKIQATLQERGIGYWAKLVEAQALSVDAWVHLSRGQSEEAIALQTQAADIEDKIGKSPVTPGHVLPARELLGDMLVILDHAEPAMMAYEKALELSPNRRRSVAALEDL